MKPHQIFVHYKNEKVDTILTNGTIHQLNGWYNSKVDLLEKYSYLSDTIKGQLKTAERLKDLMAAKNYDEAIQLFSKRQQENIKEIKQDKEMFAFWCIAWMFYPAKYQYYVAKIKKGKAHFVFEDDEWKIDEK